MILAPQSNMVGESLSKVTPETVKITSINNTVIFTDAFLLKQRMVESGNKQYRISGKGARGVAQFMPTTWRWLKETKVLPSHLSILNKEHQIIAQRIYMEYLYNRPWKRGINKFRATVASYNCGRGRVLKLIKKHGTKHWEGYLPRETRNYLKKLI